MNDYGVDQLEFVQDLREELIQFILELFVVDSADGTFDSFDVRNHLLTQIGDSPRRLGGEANISMGSGSEPSSSTPRTHFQNVHQVVEILNESVDRDSYLLSNLGQSTSESRSSNSTTHSDKVCL
jgi:hypothetical protein